MMNEYMFMSSPTDAETLETEETTEVSNDEIYAMLDDLDKRVSDLQLETAAKRYSDEGRQSLSTSTPTDIYLASITDAVGEIQKNTYDGYTWIVILAFVIVIFETKKLFRGAIKTWYDKE